MITTRSSSAIRTKRNAASIHKARQTRQSVEQVGDYLLSVDQIFKKRLNISALRPPARLLMFLSVRRSVTIKEAMHDSALSYRAFYVMLDSLKDAELVRVERDDHDMRVRRLVLGTNFGGIAKFLCEVELS